MFNVFCGIDFGHFAFNGEARTASSSSKMESSKPTSAAPKAWGILIAFWGPDVSIPALLHKSDCVYIEANRAQLGEPCVDGFEMGDMAEHVDDPN